MFKIYKNAEILISPVDEGAPSKILNCMKHTELLKFHFVTSWGLGLSQLPETCQDTAT